ncbi:hypothetical protein HAZT_HAZT003474 [Hyalella azteca]|uniref:DOMON domain-containing protein n=1 Tax=Hyalella azteca TaxID=294128 RepID=A0A6A0GXJ3_HYAAZ|nr:hypothetical protein HAZT_HAZT003474 [Hyalella azteca]
MIDRLSGLLVPNNRGRRSVIQQRRLSRSRRFAVPLLKSGGNETVSGEVVTSTQAEPEPESKAEPGSKAEPNAKAEPEPEAEAEPKSEADSKAEPEPEAEPKASAEIGANAKMDRLSGDTPWVPRDAGLHAMDCTDIVVGTAHGNSYRVMDYYTRDRSTPRPDSFWGGEDSITAALGWEQDGVTTIVFRKPVLATHPSDQAIEKGPMHVIWALGQEPGRYVHSPPSGLEKGAPSVPDFYRRDELKYHGRGDQRGTLTMELLGDTASRAPGAQTVDWCGGQFGSPAGCSVRDNTCKYHARWEYLEGEDLVRYSVTSSAPQRWTGIGFSDNTKMVDNW